MQASSSSSSSSSSLSQADEEKIASLILSFYSSLSVHGKPKSPTEYTVLAAFVAIIDSEEDSDSESSSSSPSSSASIGNEPSTKRVRLSTSSSSSKKEYVLLSMATGTKSLGHSLIDPLGSTLNDSHAEILAHRSLLKLFQQAILRLLIEEKIEKNNEKYEKIIQKLENFSKNNEKIIKNQFLSFTNHFLCPFQRNFLQNNEKNEEIHLNTDRIDDFSIFSLKKNWRICLYVSDPLCGDASLFSRTYVEEISEALTGAKAFGYEYNKEMNPVEEYLLQREKIYYQLKNKKKNEKNLENDEKNDQINLQMDEKVTPLGWIRTKSGRNDLPSSSLSLSLSCSDKVTKWIQLGLQGSFLYNLVGFIPLDTVIIGLDPTATSKEIQLEAMERALHSRCSPSFSLNLCQSINNFKPKRTNIKILSKEFSFPNSICNVQNNYWNDMNNNNNKNSPLPCGSNLNWYLDYFSPSFFYTKINSIEDINNNYSFDFSLIFNELIEIFKKFVDIDRKNEENGEQLQLLYNSLYVFLKDIVLKYEKSNHHEKSSASVYSFIDIKKLYNKEKYNKLIDKLKNLKFLNSLGQVEVTISHTGLPLGSNNKGKMNEKLKISRISPLIFRLYQEIIILLLDDSNIKKNYHSNPICTYKKWKNSLLNNNTNYNNNNKSFFDLPIFENWKKKSLYFIDK